MKPRRVFKLKLRLTRELLMPDVGDPPSVEDRPRPGLEFTRFKNRHGPNLGRF